MGKWFLSRRDSKTIERWSFANIYQKRAPGGTKGFSLAFQRRVSGHLGFALKGPGEFFAYGVVAPGRLTSASRTGFQCLLDLVLQWFRPQRSSADEAQDNQRQPDTIRPADAETLGDVTE